MPVDSDEKASVCLRHLFGLLRKSCLATAKGFL